MKFLKPYKIFESIEDNQFLKTKEEIKSWITKMGLSDFDIIKGNNIYLDKLKELIDILDIENFDYDKLHQLKNYNIIE